MSDRDELLKILRVRPDWLLDDEPDPADDEFWDVRESIKQPHYDNGNEVNLSALVDLMLASAWLRARDARVAAEALTSLANTFQGDNYGGTEVAHRLRARATEYREQATE